MKTYTICGSMRFEQEMKEIAFFLETQKGFNILQCIYTDREVSEEEKRRLQPITGKSISAMGSMW